MNETDAQLEGYIMAAWRVINEAATEEAKREAFENMRKLVGERSQERVAQMERERGLR
jgi:hypothetical protein